MLVYGVSDLYTDTKFEVMSHISEYFPRHVWILLIVLAGIATIGLFVPPSVTEPLGLSTIEHIIVVGIVEFGSAVGIGLLVVTYRDTESEKSEWQYDPE